MDTNARNKKTILRFLNSQPLAVISTIHLNSRRPEAALIAFVEMDTFEIIFETQYTARKYKNLQENSSVALVMGWDPIKHVTLQYEGKAQEIRKEDVDKYRKIFLKKKTPCTEEFLFHPDVRFFKVTPIWIGYSDYTDKKPKIIEIQFK